MHPKATVFEFISYTFEPSKKRVIFHYKTEFSNKEPLFFTETILLPKVPDLHDVSKEIIDKLLQSLHIILGISYYKFYCATKVTLSYTLSKKEADFWNTIYKKGLGEFFYKNNLDPKISPKFPFSKTTKTINYSLSATHRSLLGVGGGKDSIVVAELLKQHGFNFDTFVVQTQKESPLIKKIIEIIDVGDVKIQRFLDWQIFQKHQYDGHIPVSAIYAFLGIFSAVLYRYSYFIVGNEHSSNFGNINYRGLEVNHQWSKSFEFETLFQNYVKDFITPDVYYFSLLRPFYEIRIVKMFAKYNPSTALRVRKYFPIFSSCNGNFKIAGNQKTLWCGLCAKCAFVFILLSAYLSKKELINIFGKNLYEDENLLLLFKDVLGFGKIKPFDCVGTFKEAQTALFLAKKNFGKDFIVRHFGKRVKYHKEVFQTNKDNNIPEQFKFLGMENVLIAGFGKEGQITKKYLQKYYPKLKIGIADSKQGSDYLKKQEDFDIAIKTPGIKKELIKIPYTTATNIFFSHLRQGFGGQAKVSGKNTTIGITGSKGKSTTASLIFAILKGAGKNIVFLGNIGKPMLQALMNPIKKDTIFVLELSSYQLDDIKFSPDIAVVTNLFQEHMDYHGNVKNYHQAKKNIINFQNENSYFIFNPKDSVTKTWLKNQSTEISKKFGDRPSTQNTECSGYKGRAIPFSKKIFENNLIGNHNQDNIRVAIAVAKIMNVPDSAIKTAVKNFKALPHRLEFVGEFKGIKFINDANAAIPEATIMAITSLPKIDTIFLGGLDRGYNFYQLEKIIKKYKIRNIVLFPNSGDKIIKNKKYFNVLKTKSMKEAVVFAYKNTKKGYVCLLSCASPSYSLWKNFEEKGDQFKKFVKLFAK